MLFFFFFFFFFFDVVVVVFFCCFFFCCCFFVVVVFPLGFTFNTLHDVLKVIRVCPSVRSQFMNVGP